MGRDKPKKYNKMNYQQKEVYVKNQLQQYGGGAVYRDNGGARGSASTGMFDLEASRNVLEKKMRNDFDYRTSAQHMDDIEGDASMSDFVNYQRGAVKLHKKAGNGGEYSSNEDITTVTNNLVKDYRRGLQDDIGSSNNDDEQTGEAITPTDTFTEPSEETVQARETVKAWQGSNLGGNVYGTNSTSPATSAFEQEKKRAVTTNVDEFVANYKNDVYKGAKMRPDIPV